METESLLEGMDISFSVKWEKNGVKPYGIPEANPRKLFRVSFKRKNPREGEMKTLSLRYYGLFEPNERAILLILRIKKPKEYSVWVESHCFNPTPETRKAHAQIVNDHERVLAFFSREGEIEKIEEFYQENSPREKFKNYKRNPSIVLSLNPLTYVPRIPIERLHASRILESDLAIRVPSAPFFLTVQHMEDSAPGKYKVLVWRSLNKNLVVNENGNLSQYVFHKVENLSLDDALEKMQEFYSVLSQDVNAIFEELGKEVGASASFVPFTQYYGWLVWHSPSPEMPEVSTEILDKVEAKCNEVFPFLLKRIRVTEDSEKGETKFKFYMK